MLSQKQRTGVNRFAVNYGGVTTYHNVASKTEAIQAAYRLALQAESARAYNAKALDLPHADDIGLTNLATFVRAITVTIANRG